MQSVVWDYYDIKKINGKEKAICKHCVRVLGGESKNGTSHLHKHLSRCPKLKGDTNKRQKRSGGTPSIGGYNFDLELLREKIAI